MHTGRVGVNTAWHAAQTQEMHREEGHVESDKEEPEVDLPECLAQHMACNLRNPVVEAREHGEKCAADQDIMKMSDNKI